MSEIRIGWTLMVSIMPCKHTIVDVLTFGIVTNPLPLIEMTIDQATMQLGQNGTTFFSFNHTFTNFVVPGLSSANSGTIGSVALTQGGLATLPLIATTSLDIIGAQYSVRYEFSHCRWYAF